MTGGGATGRFEVTRREVNVSLLAAAFAAAAGLRVATRVAPTHLFDFAIAGAFYYELAEVLASLVPGTRLALVREADNPHDANAVAVYSQAGAKLGFVPRVANTPIAQLLDSGHAVHAEVKELLRLDRRTAPPKDLVFTSVASGDPVIRLTTFHLPTSETRT